MIGHIVAGNELDGFALTADEKMAGDAQGVDDAEKRMLVRVDLVGNNFSTAPVLYSKGGREYCGGQPMRCLHPVLAG